MSQHRKLFDRSEIEYITPFLKLWMSFNNWYKEDLPNIKTDREAINQYKSEGKIKKEFLRLLNGRSNEDEKFQDSLAGLVKNVMECSYDDFDFPSNLFTRNPSERVIQSKNLVFISAHAKEFYFTSGDESRFYENLLEIIYKIRCKLVHGDFDIEDEIFIDFVEKAYKIMYPIMSAILQNQADGEFYIKSVLNNVDAVGIFDEGKMYVLPGSKIRKETVASYGDTTERDNILNTKAMDKGESYIIKERVEFSSPSSASSFCLGNSSNGWEDWKTKSGKTMNEVLRQN